MEHLVSTRIRFDVHCLHIRHKAMYINTPTTDLDEDIYNELYDSGCHWCAQTQTGFGPDGQGVRPDLCLDGRSCCETLNVG